MKTPMRIIVVGTSAGGLNALQKLLRGIPPDINAAIFIVQHTSPEGPGLLPELLRSASALPIAHPHDQEQIRRCRVYIAPPNRHMVIFERQVWTTNGPRENHSRPAIDPLFRSAALHYGSLVIGIVLTGTLDDGTAGLWAVKERGGVAIVQHPDDADFAQMPLNALTHVRVDHCLPLAEIGALVGRLASESRPDIGESAVAKDLELETRIANEEIVSKRELLQISDPTVFTCPECHGALLQLKRGGILRFRCHTGHAFSVQTLLTQLTTDIENNLWTAIRSMEESVLLLDHVAKHLHGVKQSERLASYFTQTARATERHAGTLRQVVLNNEPLDLELLDGVEKTDPAAPIPDNNTA
jgi:two-component system, chemotaxis family, protein-glutamate methylesterase/glutaminase